MICQSDFEFNIVRNFIAHDFFITSKSAFNVGFFNLEAILIKTLLKIPAISASFVIILSSDFKLNFELMQSLYFKPNPLNSFQIVRGSDLPFSILF